MDTLQLFYLVSIFFMVFVFVTLCSTLIALWIIKNKVVAVQKDIKEKIHALKYLRIGKKIIAEDAGSLIAEISNEHNKMKKKGR